MISKGKLSETFNFQILAFHNFKLSPNQIKDKQLSRL